jgi:hypothetical protein
VIALLSSELRRVRSRRLLLGALVLSLVGIAATGIIVAVNSRPPTEAQLAQARESFRIERRECLAGRWVPEEELPPGETLEEFCAREVRSDMFLPDDRFRLAELTDVIMGSSFILIVGGWVLGASLAGAEFQAGSVATLLTWEPRRVRVFATRTVATAATVFVLAVLLLAAFSLVMALVASTRGVTEGIDAGWARTLAGTIARVSVVSTVGAVLGSAIATLGRTTAAAVGAGFLYLGVVEGLIRGLRPRWQPYLLGDNVVVFVSGHPMELGPFPHTTVRTVGQAAVAVAIYVGAALVLAGGSFRARDVH